MSTAAPSQPVASGSSAAKMGHGPKQELYAAHIRTELLPALSNLGQGIGKLEYDIAEYDQLSAKIGALLVENGKGKARTVMSELGGGVWVDTEIYDTAKILLDLGLDLHLELPLSEAERYVKKRVEILRKRRAGLKVKEEHLRWQIQQFQGAIVEASVGTPPQQAPNANESAA